MRQIGLLFAVLVGCACAADTQDGDAGKAGDVFRSCLSKGILLENRVCMMPVGIDSSGCRQYSASSDAGATAAVIHYRKADGSFTIFRSEADCADG